MAGSSFGQGFGEAFSKGMEQRRLREQLGMEEERAKRQEAIQQQQFQQQMQQRQAEQRAEEEFKRSQLETQQKQLELQTRQIDNSIAMGFEKAFDPKTPKAYRKYLLTTMARNLNIDVKSPQFKDFETMINDSENEELESLRVAVGTLLPSLQPGQVQALSKAWLSGNVNMQQLTELANSMQKGQMRKDILERFSGAASQPEDVGGVSDVVPGTVLPGPDDISLTDEPDIDGGTGNFEKSMAAKQSDVLKERQAEIERTKARRDAFHDAGLLEDARLEEAKLDDLMRAGEMEPEVRGAIKRAELSAEQELELDKTVNPEEMLAVGMPGTKLTKREAQELGIAVGTLKPDDLIKLNQQKGAVKNTVRQIKELKILAQKAGPAAIGNIGAFVRSMDSFIEQALAIPNLAGMGEKEFRKNTAKLARETFQELPEKSAVIQSRVIDLARSMARARDVGMLSNQDIEDAKRQLAASGGSLEQFLAVLDDMEGRVLEGAATNAQSTLGVQPLDLMPSDGLSELLHDPSAPDYLIKAIEKEMDRRIKELKKLQELRNAK